MTAIYVEPAPAIPLVSITVAARGGAAADPGDRAGLAHHVSELAVRGAGDRDRAAIDEAFDRLGAQLAVTTRRDSFSYSATVLRRNLDAVCELLADVLAAPRFDAGEHGKLARETMADLEDLRDDDFEVAARCFNSCYAPGHPYGRPIEGDAASVAAIAALDPAELAAVFRRQVAPDNLVIGLAGAIDAGAPAAAGVTLLDRLSGEPPPLPALEPPPLPERPRVILVDKPERSQSQILLGHRGPRFGTVDATAMTLVEAAFGGMFSSRLMREIRVKRGWSYGAGMRMARTRGEHWLRLSLAPSAEVTPDAIELVVSLYRELRDRGLDTDEIEMARRYVTGSAALAMATPRQRLHARITADTFGLPADHIDTFAERIAAITEADVAAAIERHVHPESLTIVAVATAERMRGPLEKLGLGEVEVVGY